MTKRLRIVDAFSSQPHYADHLRPIFDAMEGGTFYVGPNVPREGMVARALRPSDEPVLIAGYPDLKRIRRPAVFVEHGAGENYGRVDPHYSGGAGRENVVLFLCPNQRVADANAKYDVPSVVVGSPRVEWLNRVIDKDHSGGSRDGHPLRVAVSFHWNCRIHPQAGTALFEYQRHFNDWSDPRIEIKGHAHPRIAARAKRMYPFGFIEDFTEVLRWADVYAVDNSSTLFEAVACGLPVVVLDSIHYTPEETGWRFWKYADVGPRISPGDDFVEAALSANHNRVTYDAVRHQAVTEIFGTLEGATERAVRAIHDHAWPPRSTPSPDTSSGNPQPSHLGLG